MQDVLNKKRRKLKMNFGVFSLETPLHSKGKAVKIWILGKTFLTNHWHI
jgi:hypothetical protein